MRLPHKRVLNTHLSEAPDKWAALYHQLRQQRGFTREYNDKQRQHAAHARKNVTRSNAHRHVQHESTIHIQGNLYKFTRDATQHAPTTPLTDQHDMFNWTNPPTNMVPAPNHQSTASSCKPKLIQPKPLGLHATFKKHVIRHTNHDTNGAVLDVVYADHAIPKAFLAERWVAKGKKQLLTTWEPHVVMRKHLALWATRGYTPKRINSVNNKVSSTDNNTRKHWYGRGPARVEWNDTWEPVQGCQTYSNFQILYHIFQAARNTPPKPRCPPTRQDMHLHKLARIGIGREPAIPPAASACLRQFMTCIDPPCQPRHGHKASTYIHTATSVPPSQRIPN
jgi:hypothetical protein